MNAPARLRIAPYIYVLTLAACGPGPSRTTPSDGGPTAPDGGASPDGSAPRDSGSPQVDAARTSPDAGSLADDADLSSSPDTNASTIDSAIAPGDGTCTHPLDLHTVGTMRSDGAVVWYGNDSMAPAAPLSDVPQTVVCGTGDTYPRIYQLVFKYTMRTTAYLETNTDLPSASLVNVEPQQLDACNASANQLDCTIDNGTARGTSVSTAPIAAGTRVYIVLGGVHFPLSGADSGDIALEVTELPPIPSGGACDPRSLVDSCAVGDHCTGSGTVMNPGPTTCVADGTSENARCRLDPPYCDAPLGCSEDVPTLGLPGMCQPPVADGAACGANVWAFVCVAGDHCVYDAPGSGTCRRDGSSGGQCRPTPPECDAGLTCGASFAGQCG